jgi:RNA polymerase sigma factor (sigma-70 family)
MAVTETGHRASREVDDLYRRHGPDVYRYAYAVLGNHADAEDVTQTTFLNAYRALEQGVRPRKPANWLLTIASNAIKQRFRQEQSRPRVVELDDQIAGHDVEDDGPSVGELLTALSKIPPQQRQAIVLREFEGRSYSEIAGILSVTTSALETLLFRARRSLAEELEHQLTCTDAQLAISKSVDDRLGRKERRRLRDHLAECPDCAQFARLQQKHRSALRGLMLIPIPLSLAMFKGLEGAGTASAATAPVIPLHATTGTTLGTGSATTAGVGTGSGAATGGGFFLGTAAVKVAAAVVAVTVAGGAAITGALEIERGSAPKTGASEGIALPAAKTKAATARATSKRTAATPKRATTRGSNRVAAAAPLRTRSAGPLTETATSGSSGSAAQITSPEQTAGPEQTGTPQEQSPTSGPTQTAPTQSAPTKTAPTTDAVKTTKRTTKKPTTAKKKGKRVAGAKRANKTATEPNVSSTTTRGQPSANANPNATATGNNGGSSDANSGKGNGNKP